MSEIAYVRNGVTYYMDGLAHQVMPNLLRRAIENVGIEKRSDYTLVLEEVERLMKTDAVHEYAMSYQFYADVGVITPSEEERALIEDALNGYLERYDALIRAATDLVKEAEEMGFGETSEKALPGSWDKFKLELDRVTK